MDRYTIQEKSVENYRYSETFRMEESMLHETTYCGDSIPSEDMVLLAKLQAANINVYSQSKVLLMKNNQILWGSDIPDRGADCSNLLKTAKIKEIYDDAVDLSIKVFNNPEPLSDPEEEILTVYCYYDEESCTKPKAGFITQNGEKGIPFMKCEVGTIQEVLDRTEFKQYQFGRDIVEPEENEEMARE